MRYLKLFENFESENYQEFEDDFGFESPFCTSCKGTGCEECDGSGMKRNSIINSTELDYDSILSELKSMGWGDLSPERFDDFEESDYYSGTTDIEQYASEMNNYMHDISTGIID